MSAWRITQEHIALLVDVAMNGPQGAMPNTWGPIRWSAPSGESRQVGYHDFEQAESLGRMLDAENEHSILARYPGDLTYAEVGRKPFDVQRTKVWPRLNVGEAFSLISCYEYQTCESEDWATTEAHDFCDRLRHNLIRYVPGYDAAPWGWGADEVNAALDKQGLRGAVSIAGMMAETRKARKVTP